MTENENQELRELSHEIEEEFKPKREKKEYTREGVRIIQCSKCRKDEFLSRIGKIDGYVYCSSCYLMRIAERINDWKIDYRRYRNGKENFEMNEINSKDCPKLSSYIN